MKAYRPKISLTRKIPLPSVYVQALDGEFSEHAFNEERALEYKGCWRSKVYGKSESTPLDLEIGTGNGYHFAHFAKQNPERLLLGIELKYKPLIQSIRRALREGSLNAKILRYNARYIEDLFVEGELDNVIIHFPDPWEGKKSRKKNRLIQPLFLEKLYKVQKENRIVDFKTDCLDYFNEALKIFELSNYKVTAITRDLHNSEFEQENFITGFERIFINKGLKINYLRAEKLKA